jgi:hypothetical protein
MSSLLILVDRKKYIDGSEPFAGCLILPKRNFTGTQRYFYILA